MRKNNLLQSTTEKVSRVLTEKYGMNVVFRGASCHTDGETIYLPSLPEDVPEDLLGALRGWADHECSHALFTQISVGAKFTKKHGPRAFSILNTLEDVRVEHLMAEKYPGAGVNIRRAYRYLTSKGKPPEAFKALVWALYSRAKGLDDFKGVPPDIYGLMDDCRPETDRVLSCRSTSEAAALAESIWLKIAGKIGDIEQKRQGGPEDAREQQEQDGECGGGEDPESDSGEGEKELDGGGEASEGSPEDPESARDREEGADGGGHGSEEESGQDQQGLEPDSCEDGSGEEDGDSGEERDRENPPVDGDASGDTGPSGPPRDESQVGGEPASSGPDAGREEDASPMGQVRDQIKKSLSPADNPGSYRVYTTEHDEVDRPEISDSRWREDLREFRPQVGGLMRRLVHTLRGRSEKNWLSEQSRGSLDPGSLHRLATGSSARIFRRRTERGDGPTACTLLLDLSSSMHGPQIKLCRNLALIFGETLGRLSFPTEIIGFSTTNRDLRYEISQLTGMSEKDLAMQYSRLVPLYHAVFKSFDEPWSRGAGRMGDIRTRALTPLGESLLFAGRRLAKRAEARKVLFCLTDGKPVTGAWDEGITMRHACRAVERLEDAGIETVGIGIMESCVEDLFPSCAVVYSLEKLASTFARRLCQVLTERRMGTLSD